MTWPKRLHWRVETLIDIQHWLYQGIGEGIGRVAGGDHRTIWVAMATAMLFGAVHALMPGHGKIVLISFHLGKSSSPAAAFNNGAILALTHWDVTPPHSPKAENGGPGSARHGGAARGPARAGGATIRRCRTTG